MGIERVSNLLARIGLAKKRPHANPAKLATNIHGLYFANPQPFLAALVRNGIILTGSKNSVNSLTDIRPDIISGAIDQARIDSLYPELVSNYSGSQTNSALTHMSLGVYDFEFFSLPVYAKGAAKLAFILGSTAAAVTFPALLAISFGAAALYGTVSHLAHRRMGVVTKDEISQNILPYIWDILVKVGTIDQHGNISHDFRGTEEALIKHLSENLIKKQIFDDLQKVQDASRAATLADFKETAKALWETLINSHQIKKNDDKKDFKGRLLPGLFPETLDSFVIGTMLPNEARVHLFNILQQARVRNHPYLKLAFDLGAKALPFTLLPAVVSIGLTTYSAVRDYFYPSFSPDNLAVVSCLDDHIMVAVDGRETDLISLTGEDATAHCEEGAQNLNDAIANGNLYRGDLEIDGPLIRLDHSWLPFSGITLLDLSREPLSAPERADAIAMYFRNLHASGIMPTGDELARVRITALERQLPVRLFRDPRLQGKLELASLYQAVERYTEAETTAREIVNFDLSVYPARPMFSDEAIFSLVDFMRSRTMRTWNPEYLTEAMRLLIAERDRLHSLEDGYLARYNSELLKTCALAGQSFPLLSWAYAQACTPGDIATYLQNATFTYNRTTPAFSDNFIAVRAMIETAKYHITQNNLTEARRQYRTTLAFLDLIDSCSVVTQGDVEQNWQIYSPYMADVDLAIGNSLDHTAGLQSFARRCEVSRALRGEHPPFSSNQFDSDAFLMFRAQVNQGLATIEQELADSLRGEQREGGLLGARNHIELAYNSVLRLQSVDVARFYAAMFEERQVYYEVLMDYANILFDLYCLGQERYQGSLGQIEQLATEVYELRAEEPLDISYLRALFLLAEIDLANNRNGAAADKLDTIISNINAQADGLTAGQTLPPHYEHLLADSLIRRSVIR